MRAVLVIALVVAGLAAGPVLRSLVVLLAVPPGEPWRRACPACTHPARPASRIVALTGRCSACHARLGPPVLSTELLTAALLGPLAVRFPAGLTLAALCWLALCAVPLAVIDATVRRLPDLLTVPALLGTALLLAVAAVTGDHGGTLGRAAVGGALSAALYLLLFLISPGGIGPGDVKLAPSLGLALAWLGWASLAGGILAGFLLGAVWGVVLIAGKRANRRAQIPFGPFMIAGTFLVLLING